MLRDRSVAAGTMGIVVTSGVVPALLDDYQHVFRVRMEFVEEPVRARFHRRQDDERFGAGCEDFLDAYVAPFEFDGATTGVAQRQLHLRIGGHFEARRLDASAVERDRERRQL